MWYSPNFSKARPMYRPKDSGSLTERVEEWSGRLRVHPRAVRDQRLTRKWGSCFMGGTVTLASDLAKSGAVFLDFVIAHELLDLKVPNHGRVFKALISVRVPGGHFLFAGDCTARHSRSKLAACGLEASARTLRSLSRLVAGRAGHPGEHLMTLGTNVLAVASRILE